jgi:hypothetical protein
MKKVLSLLAIASLLTTACTKNSHGSDDLIPHNKNVEDNPNGGGGNNTTTIPMAVLSAFNTRYAGAAKIEWKLLSDGTYKAEFFISSVKWQAIFTSGGTLVKQEHS